MEEERPLWDYRRGERDCPHDFTDWDFEPFRSDDGRLKRLGWCPTCWLGTFLVVGENPVTGHRGPST